MLEDRDVGKSRKWTESSSWDLEPGYSGARVAPSPCGPSSCLPAIAPPPAPGRREDELADLEVKAIGLQAPRGGER